MPTTKSLFTDVHIGASKIIAGKGGFSEEVTIGPKATITANAVPSVIGGTIGSAVAGNNFSSAASGNNLNLTVTGANNAMFNNATLSSVGYFKNDNGILGNISGSTGNIVAIAVDTNSGAGYGGNNIPRADATISYVNNFFYGLSLKQPCKVDAGSKNINLASPGNAIDGVNLSAGDRVLVRGQLTGTQNGIYRFVASNQAMVRTDDFNGTEDLSEGVAVFVTHGSSEDEGFVVSSSFTWSGGNPSSAVTWSQWTGAGNLDATAGFKRVGQSLEWDAQMDHFTANANQTAFNISKDINAVVGTNEATRDNLLNVYRNGLEQVMGASADYRITDANTITFNSGLVAGDEVLFYYFP